MRLLYVAVLSCLLIRSSLSYVRSPGRRSTSGLWEIWSLLRAERKDLDVDSSWGEAEDDEFDDCHEICYNTVTDIGEALRSGLRSDKEIELKCSGKMYGHGNAYKGFCWALITSVNRNPSLMERLRISRDDKVVINSPLPATKMLFVQRVQVIIVIGVAGKAS
ncbi:hypothetical protein OESDEN_03519 [Oesophagostomum dentatum]|uniref:Uncharacterized protein n=1 Tax=Oesophagostomum dentatum TaxID=61180 RepID=A0A0B1TM85_OESDE|nr:hypothetical protein OESDEN_03519 [Oesophagostomum dentatum]